MAKAAIEERGESYDGKRDVYLINLTAHPLIVTYRKTNMKTGQHALHDIGPISSSGEEWLGPNWSNVDGTDLIDFFWKFDVVSTTPA